MGTLTLNGAISDAYRKVSPKNPVGKNNENMKMNTAATTTHEVLDICEEAPAIIAMQDPIPKAANIINFLLPNRSTVKTPIGEHRVCQVKTEALRMRDVCADNPRPPSKIVAW
ncbi:hypothetical protein EYC80_001339 [Monilinia laxa]|uniref:Uncharacterized protein n=1 Tax=Monilinia laxa TaxID=61186 RepID=A0A5N6K960_MONLA|nr:hypothetical protein EYC80_001339 [Monilinia laxa]